jgi:hypothetical protein
MSLDHWRPISPARHIGHVIHYIFYLLIVYVIYYKNAHIIERYILHYIQIVIVGECLMDIAIPVLISAFMVGLFGAMKFYSNTLGSNPESFDLRKFAPLAILGIAFSVGSALMYGAFVDAAQVAEYISVNFMWVLFINTVLTIIGKKFPSIGQYIGV